MMGWPKGLKRNIGSKPQEQTGTVPGSASLAVLEEHIEKLNNLQSTGPAPELFPDQNQTMTIKRSFETGKWYIYEGTPEILTDTASRVLKWSVIKFEVVKTAFGIVAVRFEDGSFEAIVDPDFTQFKEIKTPKY